MLSATLGIAPDDSDPEGLIAAAAAAAAASDIAVVVVGTNSKVESEGYDRENLDLPGRQDDLVRAVAAANPRTIVIVNAGSPVALPWADDVAAIVLGYFGGQEFGTAIGRHPHRRRASPAVGCPRRGPRRSRTCPSPR